MATPQHFPTDWNDILSSTIHNYRQSMTDNIFDSRPLLNFHKSRKRTVSGGVTIVEPLLFAEGDFTAYQEWDPVQVTPKNTLTTAQYDWRLLAGTVAISGLEEAQNNSKEMQVNLLEAKLEQQTSTISQAMNRMCFGTYGALGGVNPANGFYGLPQLISHAAIAAGNIVDEDWWESQVNDLGAGDGAPGTTDGAGLEKALRDAYNQSSDAGSDRVDAIFTNAYGFGFYESTLTPQVRYTDVEKANLGFQNLMFKNVPMYWDFDCPGVDDFVDGATTPGGTLVNVSDTQACFYGINSKYVGIVCHSDRDMAQSPFTDNLSGSTGTNSTDHATPGKGSASASALDARISYNTTYGNQTTRNRRRLFKVINVQEA